MNYKKIILQYRTQRAIKGHRPTIIFLAGVGGDLYAGGHGDFIMSMGKEYLYFQRLSLFTKKLLPKKDFKVKIEELKQYSIYQKNMVTRILTFYTIKKEFIACQYFIGTKDTYESEQNLKMVLHDLEEKGVLREKGSVN